MTDSVTAGYVSGVDWWWEREAVLILGIIKRGLRSSAALRFGYLIGWEIRKGGSFSKLGYVSCGGVSTALKSSRRMSGHGDGWFDVSLVDDCGGDTWTATGLPW